MKSSLLLLLVLCLANRCLCVVSSPFGYFLFPSLDSQPTFNYLDTLNVTWTTFAHNFTSPYLQLWLTTNTSSFNQTLGVLSLESHFPRLCHLALNPFCTSPSFISLPVPTTSSQAPSLSVFRIIIKIRPLLTTKPILTKSYIVSNTSVLSNDSTLIPLNYGGAFNLSNFNLLQGTLGALNSSFYSSGLFNISKDDSLKPQTWSLNVIPPPTSTTFQSATSTLTPSSTSSISTTTSSLTTPTTAITAPTTAATSTLSRQSHLPTPALPLILTFSILAFITISALSLALCLKSRRLRNIQNTQRLQPSYPTQSEEFIRHQQALERWGQGEPGRRYVQRGELSNGFWGWELEGEGRVE